MLLPFYAFLSKMRLHLWGLKSIVFVTFITGAINWSKTTQKLTEKAPEKGAKFGQDLGATIYILFLIEKNRVTAPWALAAISQLKILSGSGRKTGAQNLSFAVFCVSIEKSEIAAFLTQKLQSNVVN